MSATRQSDLADFHNRLRILGSIDFHELVAAGAITDDNWGEIEWTHFRLNPYRYFIAADDDVCQRIWQVIERRAPQQQAAA